MDKLLIHSLSLDYVALEILLPFSMSPILFDAHALQAGASTNASSSKMGKCGHSEPGLIGLPVFSHFLVKY